MIDKNEINKLLIDAKANLIEQIRLMGKTAELIDYLTETIQNEEMSREELLSMASVSLHYYYELARFMNEATSDEEKALLKILDLIQNQNKD